MQIIKWEPFGAVDEFFNTSSPFPVSPFPRIGWDMAVDVFEQDGNVVAKMSVPGIKADELDISIEHDMLTISGRRNEEDEIDTRDYYSKEIRRGSFSRSVCLPRSVDADKAQATYFDGVLVVTTPVLSGTRKKSIRVKVI